MTWQGRALRWTTLYPRLPANDRAAFHPEDTYLHII
ncbi:hypothetical protein BH24GEM3_BH24GEM3_09990 [soil metagenome]